MPLAVVASGVLMAIATAMFVSNKSTGSNFTAIAFLSLYGISWLLLGVVLWSTRGEMLVREQPA